MLLAGTQWAEATGAADMCQAQDGTPTRNFSARSVNSVAAEKPRFLRGSEV